MRRRLRNRGMSHGYVCALLPVPVFRYNSRVCRVQNIIILHIEIWFLLSVAFEEGTIRLFFYRYLTF